MPEQERAWPCAQQVAQSEALHLCDDSQQPVALPCSFLDGKPAAVHSTSVHAKMVCFCSYCCLYPCGCCYLCCRVRLLANAWIPAASTTPSTKSYSSTVAGWSNRPLLCWQMSTYSVCPHHNNKHNSSSNSDNNTGSRSSSQRGSRCSP